MRATATGAKVTGTFEVTGATTATGGVTGLPAPSAGSDAASKDYVDKVFISAGYVHADGTRLAYKGSVTPTTSKSSTGNYVVTVAGLTTNAIVILTKALGSAGYIRIGTVSAGGFTVNTNDTAGAAVDSYFHFLVIQL
jgi:hypothetical protein